MQRAPSFNYIIVFDRKSIHLKLKKSNNSDDIFKTKFLIPVLD